MTGEEELKAINQLYDSGLMNLLAKKGFVRPHDANLKIIVTCVSEFQKRGCNKTNAVKETSEVCKVSIPFVWVALKRWESL